MLVGRCGWFFVSCPPAVVPAVQNGDTTGVGLQVRGTALALHNLWCHPLGPYSRGATKLFFVWLVARVALVLLGAVRPWYYYRRQGFAFIFVWLRDGGVRVLRGPVRRV